MDHSAVNSPSLSDFYGDAGQPLLSPREQDTFDTISRVDSTSEPGHSPIRSTNPFLNGSTDYSPSASQPRPSQPVHPSPFTPWHQQMQCPPITPGNHPMHPPSFTPGMVNPTPWHQQTQPAVQYQVQGPVQQQVQPPPPTVLMNPTTPWYQQAPPTLYVQQRPANPLPRFSGAPAPKTGEVEYEVWRREISDILREDPHCTVGRIRSSLTGTAHNATRHCATIEQLFTELDAVYKIPADLTTIQREFFSARQQKGETVRDFYVRIHILQRKVLDADPFSSVGHEQQIRRIFWQGLSDATVKAALHYKYDAGVATAELLQAILIYSEDQRTAGHSAHNVRVQQQLANEFSRCHLEDQPGMTERKTVQLVEDSSSSDEEFVKVTVKACRFCGKQGRGFSSCWQRGRDNMGSKTNRHSKRKWQRQNHQDATSNGQRQPQKGKDHRTCQSDRQTMQPKSDAPTDGHHNRQGPLNGPKPSSRGGRR